MELGGSLPHPQQPTTCPYPSQINPFLCPSHFRQAQLVSFLVGLRTYQHPYIAHILRVLLNNIIEGKIDVTGRRGIRILKGREDEEENVSCYWVILRRREYTVNCKRKH